MFLAVKLEVESGSSQVHDGLSFMDIDIGDALECRTEELVHNTANANQILRLMPSPCVTLQ